MLMQRAHLRAGASLTRPRMTRHPNELGPQYCTRVTNNAKLSVFAQGGAQCVQTAYA